MARQRKRNQIKRSAALGGGGEAAEERQAPNPFLGIICVVVLMNGGLALADVHVTYQVGESLVFQAR